MKHNGDQAKIGAAMAKGEAPFDLAAAQKIFATFEDTAVKASALFQENSVEEATADDEPSSSGLGLISPTEFIRTQVRSR